MPKISIYLPEKAADLVDAVCEETGASRSEVIQSAIHMFFDQASLRVGAVRALYNRMKNGARNAKKEVGAGGSA